MLPAALLPRLKAFSCQDAIPPAKSTVAAWLTAARHYSLWSPVRNRCYGWKTSAGGSEMIDTSCVCISLVAALRTDLRLSVSPRKVWCLCPAGSGGRVSFHPPDYDLQGVIMSHREQEAEKHDEFNMIRSDHPSAVNNDRSSFTHRLSGRQPCWSSDQQTLVAPGRSTATSPTTAPPPFPASPWVLYAPSMTSSVNLATLISSHRQRERWAMDSTNKPKWQINTEAYKIL